MNEEQFAVLLSRLDRIEALLNPAITPDPLAIALAASIDGEFTSAEVMATAQAMSLDAGAQGLRTPDLPHELQKAGILTPHALGRYLATSADFEAIGTDRNGKLWVAVSRGFKTAKPLRAAPCGR